MSILARLLMLARMGCIIRGGDMKMIIALSIAGWLLIAALLLAFTSLAARASPKQLSFAEIVTDINSLGGEEVELRGIGRLHGSDLLLYKDPNSLGTFVFIQLDGLLREQRKRIVESCANRCEVVVQGEVGEDEQGNKGIIASMIQVR